MNNNIYVTKSFLPQISEYEKYIAQIWENGQLTNQGPLLRDFEQKASQYLGVDNFHFVSNGTIALQIALKSLDITEGEIITTPFSYVATTSSILWERCEPVFVDIEPDTYCIDVTKIEAAITNRTKAIMPVHVFGFPCDIEEIERIANKYNLRVIYDAAHAFGVKYKGKSLLSYGDISTCSFHSTKVFHTIEGGCVVAKDKQVSDKLELTKRFGHDVDKHIMLGINAKASEFQAAMGLCNLGYIDMLIQKRKKIFELYNAQLNGYFKTPLVNVNKGIEHNYAYYPLVFHDALQSTELIAKLNENGVFPRRYFYPSLNKLPYVTNTKSCPVSEDISSRIVCLPLYDSLSEEDVLRICKILKNKDRV